MGGHIVQDSDAESSDSSPVKVVQLKDPASWQADKVVITAAGPDTIAEYKIHNAPTTMGLIQGKDRRHPAREPSIPPREKRRSDASADEDELALLPYVKRARQENDVTSDVEAFFAGHQSTIVQFDGHNEIVAPQGVQVVIPYPGIGTEPDGPDRHTRKPPETPQLCNDLSFSSLAQSTITYANSQRSSRHESPSKWFPALDAISSISETSNAPQYQKCVSQKESRGASKESLSNKRGSPEPGQTDGADRDVPVTMDETQTAAECVAQPSEPTKRKRGRPRKSQDPGTDSKTSDAEVKDAKAGEKPAPAKPPGKKRGRKRKNRTPTPCLDSEDEDAVYTIKEQGVEGDPQARQMKPIESIEAMETQVQKTDDHNKENESVPVVPSKKRSPKNPEKHSPIRNGTVPYRVGLSKRARIEPLLRIVRK